MIPRCRLILNKMVSTASGLINSVTSGGKTVDDENPDTPAETIPAELLKPSETSPSLDDSPVAEIDESEAEGNKEVVDDPEEEPDPTTVSSNSGKNPDDVLAPGVGESNEESKLVNGEEDLISPSFVHTASGEGSSSSANSVSESFEVITYDLGLGRFRNYSRFIHIWRFTNLIIHLVFFYFQSHSILTKLWKK